MKAKKPETYKRALSHLMSKLLFTYLRPGAHYTASEDGTWNMSIMKQPPVGALVVPYAIMDAKQWWLGWYRGKNEAGYDLIESVETHEICQFANTGFLYLDKLDFADSPVFHYSDREYEMKDAIERKTAKHNYWFVVGNPVFYDDSSIDIPIRKKFTDDFYTKRYKNFRAVTITALDAQCKEIVELEKNTKESQDN